MTKTFDGLFEKFPVLRLIGNTPLVRIDLLRDEFPDLEVYAKVEFFNPGGSLKDRPVLRMLGDAYLSGELHPGRTILDSSSGNAAIAYSLIGRVMGLPVEMVVPDNASRERKRRILAHGASITFTDAQLGYDEALREVRRKYKANPEKYFFCDQYGNANNWRAHYDTTAIEIWEQTGGKITHFVAGVGTGGTITGIGRRLRELNPNIEIHCIIPDAFPGVEGLKPLGSPEDIVPEILDESVITRRWPSDVDTAWEMSQKLARSGLFAGQSSGAYMAGVYDVAKEIKKGVIVTLLCDIGERYFSTRLWDI
ncbi:MAG: PLP-dependent cysteine synthase family protein [Myxococcales bacterium]|nr:PLP-dependent cysteine synthase family protein [Myxococcales bacterium]